MAALVGLQLVLCGFVGAALLAPAPARATQSPADAIRQFNAVLLDTMQHAQQLGAKGRYQKLEPAVLNTYDVPYMTHFSVGPSWATLPAEQRRRAAAAFGRYITAVYATRFDGYSNERFQVLGEQKVRHGMIVRTQLVKSDGEVVNINYMMHDNDFGWQIRDVYLSGTISELATRRSEFAGILRGGGIEALIASMNRKADELKG